METVVTPNMAILRRSALRRRFFRTFTIALLASILFWQFVNLFSFHFNLRIGDLLCDFSTTSKVEYDEDFALESLTYCDTFNTQPGGKLSCGKRFNEQWLRFLKYAGLLDSQIAKLTDADDLRILGKDPVFVTAFSGNHYDQAQKWLIPSFKDMTSKFIVYDLGLNKSQLDELRNLSAVSQIRTFDFSQYPDYVRDLYQFRWKPILLAEVLAEHEAVFYADAHFVWTRSRTLEDLLAMIRCGQISKTCDYYSALMLTTAYHSIYAATHPGMYDFLPMREIGSKQVHMGYAGFQLIFSTKDYRTNVLKWWLLCALEQNCMAPNGSQLHCEFGNDVMGRYGDCHRQDQSAVNILVGNRNNYEEKRFLTDFAYANRD